ncbi:hypothetical protein WDD9_000478 [Paenibacillus melissococcoides]|nr:MULTISPECIES: hypothetical protein [Paenibacillus]MEB9893545.1 hypothetical protein [Bacillus cereus]GIO76848.1 hypothetical protein J6TS7_04580 [Paenibacillus dendritiformis]CAH8704067.1 hypothetical protein WDD9_000478 [Paenibacillus melissococcoides]CAH8707261.1 hypothetical protein HTL2_001563 [Paenibacillus melissococcoides]
MTLLAIAAAMLSGCFGEKPVLEEPGKEGPGTLKVVYADEESFYLLRPKAGGGSIWGGSNVNRPDEFTFGFPSLVKKQLHEMVENGKSAEAAAASIESEGNALLEQARAAQKAKANAGKK